MIARMPPTSSIVALRRCASGAAAIIVPDAVAREELEQQRAVEMAADEVRALDAVVAGADRARQVVLDVGGQLAAPAREQRLGVLGRQLGQQLPAAVAHALGLHQEHELVRVEAHGDLRRDFLQREVEDLAGRRVAERRDQHDVAVVEALLDRVDVDPPHLAGQLHVDAVAHADAAWR